ncbi:MAG TPA: hypothetical protein V6C96_02500 [Vampirovibrionales bacterium]
MTEEDESNSQDSWDLDSLDNGKNLLHKKKHYFADDVHKIGAFIALIVAIIIFFSHDIF